jgi:hypothetical protein
MMRIKNTIFIVIMSFVGRTSAMESQVVTKAQENHSKMIEALTFDVAKGRYYYKPIFKRTGKGLYASRLTDFPEKEICIDPGPVKLFWILRGRKLVKGFRDAIQDDLYVQYDKDQKKRFGREGDFIHEAQQRVNDFKKLGALQYDPEAGVYFHAKKFIVKKPAQGKKIRSHQSDIEEWLYGATILSFDSERRQYYYQHLFMGGRDTEGLKVYKAPATIDRGPLRRLITSLDYGGYDKSRDCYFFVRDETSELLEKKLGKCERDTDRWLLYHTKVFELAD